MLQANNLDGDGLMRWMVWLVLGICCCNATAAAPAEAPVAVESDGTLLEAVVVSGAQPGPGLWRVSKDDKVLWVLGTLTPVPRRMRWEAREVEQVIAASQQILRSPGVEMKADIGWFRGLLLLPAALGSRKNPDGDKLVDVVPPELYARWLPLKQRYIGRSSSIEKRRPLFAADKLYDKAIRKSGLSQDNIVTPTIKKLARRYKVPFVEPKVEFTIANPKQAIKEFAATRLDDVACFQQTLERVETDLGAMQERANAWATGDIDALRALPYTDQAQACADAVLGASVAQNNGLGNLRAQLKEAWLTAAEKALATNASTFAVLPMAEVLKADGYLATLQERGYEVEPP
jgi:hypothetical protein